MANRRRYGATYFARMPDSGTATKISELARNRDGRMYQHYSISLKVIDGCNSRSSASSVMMALWDPQYLGPSPGSSTPGAVVCPAQIQFLVKHNIKIMGSYCCHLCVSLLWYKHHPRKDLYGKPVSVWENSLNSQGCTISFQFILL